LIFTFMIFLTLSDPMLKKKLSDGLETCNKELLGIYVENTSETPKSPINATPEMKKICPNLS